MKVPTTPAPASSSTNCFNPGALLTSPAMPTSVTQDTPTSLMLEEVAAIDASYVQQHVICDALPRQRYIAVAYAQAQKQREKTIRGEGAVKHQHIATTSSAADCLQHSCKTHLYTGIFMCQ